MLQQEAQTPKGNMVLEQEAQTPKADGSLVVVLADGHTASAWWCLAEEEAGCPISASFRTRWPLEQEEEAVAGRRPALSSRVLLAPAALASICSHW